MCFPLKIITLCQLLIQTPRFKIFFSFVDPSHKYKLINFSRNPTLSKHCRICVHILFKLGIFIEMFKSHHRIQNKYTNKNITNIELKYLLMLLSKVFTNLRLKKKDMRTYFYSKLFLHNNNNKSANYKEKKSPINWNVVGSNFVVCVFF